MKEVIEDDSIVVVGQARQKKRKRTKSAAPPASSDAMLGEAPTPTPPTRGVESDEPSDPTAIQSAEKPALIIRKKGLSDARRITVTSGQQDPENFDFSAVPNILDDNPVTEVEEVRKPKKKKQKQGKGMYDVTVQPTICCVTAAALWRVPLPLGWRFKALSPSRSSSPPISFQVRISTFSV